MKRITLSLLFAITLAGQAFGAVVYSNVTNDLGQSLSYFQGSYTQIGDQIQLAGTNRLATLASVEFYNAGAAGTFDTTLRFFNVGPNVANPVGSQIGGDFTLTGIAAPLGGGLTGFVVSFALPSLLVPTDLIFTLSIANQSNGVDIVGPDLYGGPTIGISDPTFAIARDANGFLQANFQDANLYFELQADADTAIPEPATSGLAGAAILGLWLLRRARR
ncbi:MAG: PEP-CTERM sorting domain-containing protein [Acidobacteria bacterium]|nr:PEP-CTERM sorting domain-containing protein [Acidobacteriota bacterium]